MLKKLENLLLTLEKIFFSTIMAAMILILSVHVVLRFVFKSPLIWSDEVVTMLQGVIAFLGIGYCFHRGKHTELTLLYDRVPRPVQQAMDVVTNVVMLGCVAYMIKYSIDYTIFQNIPLGTIAWLKRSYFYGWIAVGFVIAEGYILVRLIRVIGDILRKTPAQGKE
ncbi:MAG: TRAP transporter small permease [Clostridiales bacterium]|nr:TRAP transporter small permease [Clostridiales bacterium]